MKRYLIFLIVILAAFTINAQENEIKGTIVAFNKYPLKNITITAKKSKQEVETDEFGQFTISVRKNDQLIIESKAFETYRHRLSNTDDQVRINLIFKESKKNRELAIAKEYIDREDLEYGIKHLMDNNNAYGNFVDIFDAIRYVLPAAQIVNVGGNRAIQIRGQKSNSGPTPALILVNGIPNEDISFIFPSDVISIKQLTSGQSAIYGSRAGAGVIAITTK